MTDPQIHGGPPAEPIALAVLVPHPPVIVPKVGRGREREAQATVDGIRRVAQRVCDARPGLIVILSPHAERRPGMFGLVRGERLDGDLSRFGAPGVEADMPNDNVFLDLVREHAAARGIATFDIHNSPLDHGVMVPLAFLIEAGWYGPTAVVSPGAPNDDFESFGAALAAAASCTGRRTALVASGDMSHRLSHGAPSGFHPRAHEFDEAFVEELRVPNFEGVRALDPRLVELAGQDVMEVTRIAMAAAGGRPRGTHVHSYEGPFGVGYCTAVLFDETAPAREAIPSRAARSPAWLARNAIETYLAVHKYYPVHEGTLAGGLPARAGVFVTLRGADGALRGCIGNISAQFPTLAEEIVDRAVAAATRDPRFEPVTRDEAGRLSVEVSILSDSEPVVGTEDLDPRRYGVIVTEEGTGRRGVMLPGVPTLDTPAQQVAAVRRKAGMADDSPVRLERFTVEKYMDAEEAGS